MGFKHNSIDRLYIDRPTMRDYPALLPEAREVVDYTISNHLKENPVLWFQLAFRVKFIQPKQRDFWQLTWSDMVMLRTYIDEQDIMGVFSLIYGIDEKRFGKLDVFNAFAAYKWVVARLHEVYETEKIMLGEELSPEEKEAGAEELQDYGYTVAVDSLAHGDLLKHSQILKMPYAIIFRKLCLDKTKFEINKRYRENASRKIQGTR